MTDQLQRIVVDLRQEEMVLRVLYRSKGDSNPGTTRRRREVTELARAGLRDALEALEGGAGARQPQGPRGRCAIPSLPRRATSKGDRGLHRQQA